MIQYSFYLPFVYKGQEHGCCFILLEIEKKKKKLSTKSQVKNSLIVPCLVEC